MANKKVEIPVRTDGMPDLNNWREYVDRQGYKTLDDLMIAQENTKVPYEKVLLSKAIHAKKTETAKSLLKVLCDESLSTRAAVSVLEIAIQKINNRLTAIVNKEQREKLQV